MAHSMTGFGASSAEADGEAVVVELRSVNHRYCDVKARLPRELAGLEPMVVARVKGRLERGACEVSLRRTGTAPGAGRVRLDLSLARDHLARLEELATALGLEGRPTLRDLAEAEGVITLGDAEIDLERVGNVVAGALDAALEQLVAMRAREGEALASDLEARLARIEAWVVEVEAEAPKALEAWRARMETRIAELAEGVEVDPGRLAGEIAILADKSDVAEEVTRLRSHLGHFRELLAGDGAVGRKLDFLVQEMNREVNTIGAKSQSTGIAERVVELKAELERVREQVQNLE